MLAKQLLQIVRNQPDAIAISDTRENKITYAHLWEHVQAYSNKIEELFTGEKYVGLVADQDIHAIITCIAVILSGRVIVPIDPRYDTKLVEQMLVPFTNKIIRAREFSGSKLATVLLREIAVSDIPQPSYRYRSSNVDAYILHTSGTTGNPKPVLADQSALFQVAGSLVKRYHISPQSRVLQFAYLSFDSSLIEIWSTLFAGGTVVVPGKQIRDDLFGCIENLLKTREITVATLPPSVADKIQNEYLFNLETLVLAGEECPAELANSLYGHIPHLINAYGPTESIICASTYEVGEVQSDRVPIGVPLPGMKMTIEDPDESGRGEIVLSSSFLSKGYADNKKNTDMKFGQNKHSKRYYRTGDIGKVRNDGNYEFVGRTDNQIKLNGQRVELEWVEAQIRNTTKINEVAVVAISNKLYCLYRSRQGLNVSENINTRLKKVLPTYAIPLSFIPIEEMPLDYNGKINRRALISVVSESQNPLHSGAAKGKCAKNEMIVLWSETLNITPDTISDNTSFFEVGGDSLSALRLVRAINDNYAVNLRLSEVIMAPTSPASMLEAVERSRTKC